jgi:hypothetical protein
MKHQFGTTPNRWVNRLFSALDEQTPPRERLQDLPAGLLAADAHLVSPLDRQPHVIPDIHLVPRHVLGQRARITFSETLQGCIDGFGNCRPSLEIGQIGGILRDFFLSHSSSDFLKILSNLYQHRIDAAIVMIQVAIGDMVCPERAEPAAAVQFKLGADPGLGVEVDTQPLPRDLKITVDYSRSRFKIRTEIHCF